MTSAAGVRYGVGMLRLSHFQQCAVRRLPSRKFPSTLQFQANHQYRVSRGIRSGTENWDRYRYFNTNACNPWEILQPVRTGRARVNGVGGVGWGGELSCSVL